MQQPFIEYKTVDLAFGSLEIFRDLNLRFYAGTKVVITGKSGMGKSSLFQLLLGFLSPGKGEILYGGVPLNAKSVWGIRQRIRHVPQEPLPGRGRVASILAEYGQLRHNRHPGRWKERLGELLEYFELKEDLLEKNFPELSGGEKQRFAIILARLFPGETYLLDEVTSALDDELKRKTVRFFMRQEAETMLAISHDQLWLEAGAAVFNLEERAWKQ